MKQARKSRYQLFGWAALAALLVVGAIGTAVANADGAGDEYTLNLPGSSNASGGGAAGGGGESSDPSASVSGANATDTTGSSGTPTETGGDIASGGSGTTAGSGGGKSGDGSNGSGSGANPNGGLVGSDQAQPETNLGAGSSSDGGGVPVFLIAIAVIAAICVGVAIWRMRRKGPDEREPGATTEIDPGTQSL